MNQIILPPERPTGFLALFAVRRAKSAPSSHAEPFRFRNLLDPKRLTHADIRERCSFFITELFKPIEPHERSNKALFRKVARVTGFGMQRIERLWRQYITKPDGLELAILGTAYFQRVEQHRETAGPAPAIGGRAREEKTLGAAVDYSAPRWRKAEGTGRKDRARGAAKTSAPDADR